MEDTANPMELNKYFESLPFGVHRYMHGSQIDIDGCKLLKYRDAHGIRVTFKFIKSPIINRIQIREIN